MTGTPMFFKGINNNIRLLMHKVQNYRFAGVLYFTFREMSRMLVIYFSIADYAALLLIRCGITVYLKKIRKSFDRTNVLIIGATESGLAAAKTIEEYHGSIYNVVGFVENHHEEQSGGAVAIVGPVADVPDLIEKYKVELVIIALPERRVRDIEQIITSIYSLPVRIYLVPDLFKLTLLQAEAESFGELVLIGIREPVIFGTAMVVKRVFDLAVSILVLALIWPVLVLIALAIKLEGPGPVLYKAKRVGRSGKIFEMYKFRTMIVGAEKLQDQVVKIDDGGRLVYKTKDDPRVTRVGRILRRLSLDELPQLINVIKGEMSLVGPRPEQPFITKTFEYWQWRRFAVPPGMTGWWQVSGRSDLPMHLNPQTDLYYVRNYSFLLDLKIILKTFGVVLRGKGAY
jgi:exopolysaccharide biosynthesis polyprenyl glycosylphosphotransferase